MKIAGNLIDDDGNGFVDDIRAGTSRTTPTTPTGLPATPASAGHGTHVPPDPPAPSPTTRPVVAGAS
jgi:hypothetical protein